MKQTSMNSAYQKYSAYKDSGVDWLGEMPEEWSLLSNKHVFKLKKNLVGKHSSEYTLLSLTLQGIIVRNLEDGGKFPAEFDTYQEVNENDFVFCLFDVEETPRCVGLSKHQGMITGAYTVLEYNPNFESRFLYYFYLNLDSDKRMRPLYTGLRNTISKENFFAFKVFTPPLFEQTAIANFLDEKTAKIDQSITQKEQLIELLKERKQIIIQNAVTKGVDPNVRMKDSGVEWIGEIPVHWEVKRLKTEVNLLTGFPFESSKYKESGIKLARGINVKEGVFNWKETRYWHEVEKHLVPFILKENDVLIGMDGSKVGKNFCIVRSEDLPILLLQRVARLRAKDTLNAKFLYYNLMNPSFLFWVNLSKTDPMVPHISPANINDFLIALPPIKEQNLIVMEIDLKLDEMMKAISQQQTLIEKLKEYKATLIDSAVTGKIKVLNYGK